MYLYTQGHSRLISTGAYLPKDTISSRNLLEEIDTENRFDVSYDWLERTTGIKEKRVVSDDLLPSDMACEAAREAMETAGIESSDIDVVIYAGMDRDYLVEPATAHVVQAKIGAFNAIAFDVSSACHGFMHAIHLMDALIATGQARRGLIVCGEQGSRHTRKTIEALRQTVDREIFTKLVGGLTLGDAGAAMIVGPKLDPDTGFMGFIFQSQGQHSSLCTCGRRGEDPLLLEINMPAIVDRAIELWSPMYDVFMKKLGWTPDDISKFLHHQVGLKVFKRHAGYAKISVDIMPNTVSTLGNLITANIPVTLNGLSKNQDVKHGEKVFIAAGGSGLAVSHTALIWNAT
jgi:acyl-CoA:acyl-CoA alkyltransferase